jgi:hypothetical protein
MSVFAGCSDPIQPLLTPRTLSLTTYATSDSTKGSRVFSDSVGLRVIGWQNASRRRLHQAALTDSRTGIRIRTFYDTASLPVRVVDEASGRFMTISVADRRADFLLYNADGSYAEGYAVFVRNGVLHRAPILSLPAFSGQLSAIGNIASVAVAPTSIDVGLGPATAASGRLGSELGAQVAASTDRKLAAEGLIYAGLLWLATEPPSGKAAPIQPGIAGSEDVPGGPVSILPVGGAIALIGLGAVVIKLSADYLAPAIVSGQLPQYLTDLKQSFMDRLEEGRESLQSLKESFDDWRNSRNTDDEDADIRPIDRPGNEATEVSIPRPTPPTSGPPRTLTNVSGIGVDRENVVYPVSGTVNGSGGVTVSGTGAGGRTMTVQGTLNGSNFNGTVSGSAGSGTLSGTAQPSGQCQQQQASGGQGTFTRLYDMGKSQGTVRFSSEAFSIPDAFRVFAFTATGGLEEVINTGLTSGSRTVAFELRGSPRVGVAVSAPQSGTQWNFQLSCP